MVKFDGFDRFDRFVGIGRRRDLAAGLLRCGISPGPDIQIQVSLHVWDPLGASQLGKRPPGPSLPSHLFASQLLARLDVARRAALKACAHVRRKML